MKQLYMNNGEEKYMENKTKHNDFEKCVICHCETTVRKEENIENREFYIEGVGQLCDKCYYEIYIKKER